MSCILVVRPEPAAETLAERLRAEGCDARAAPVVEYVRLPFTLPDLAPYQAIAFTSAAGARAFPACGLPVFCVGDATAEAAQEAGFADVRSADGDAGDLAALIAGMPGLRRVLHVSGADTARDMTPPLAARGIVLDRVAVYEARLLDALPENVMAVLDAKHVSALLFSARAATRFAELVTARGGIEILCLSSRIAAAAGPGWKATRVAESPRLDAMIALARASR
jgi:uroporphyrinogen-III synthase